MISIERDGESLTLEGSVADFKEFKKTVDRIADPAHKQQVTFRVLDEISGRHINLILRKGVSRDSL